MTQKTGENLEHDQQEYKTAEAAWNRVGQILTKSSTYFS